MKSTPGGAVRMLSVAGPRAGVLGDGMAPSGRASDEAAGRSRERPARAPPAGKKAAAGAAMARHATARWVHVIIERSLVCPMPIPIDRFFLTQSKNRSVPISEQLAKHI